MPYPAPRGARSRGRRAPAPTSLEDDYDGEYRFGGRPLDALKALDDGERVVYVGTLSKVMFPGAPHRLPGRCRAPLVEPFARAKLLADGGSAFLEQEALADFIASGAFERHIRRSRSWNGERRAALLRALARALRRPRARSSARTPACTWSRGCRGLPTPRRARARRSAPPRVGVGVYPVDAVLRDAARGRSDCCSATAPCKRASIATGVARLAEAVRQTRR